MSAIDTIITGVWRRCGILQLSAGLVSCITLFYWFNGKLSTSRKKLENTKKTEKVTTINNNMAVKNQVLDFISSEWIEVASVKELYYYPLKSGRGKPLDHCDFTDFGISYKEDGLLTLKDRMLLVYNEKTGKFQTGRNYAKLVLLSIYAVDETSVRLEANGMENLVVRLPDAMSKKSSDQIECSMWWGEPVKCIDCGSAAAAWISKFLTGDNDADLRLGLALSKRRSILKGPWEKFTKVYTTLRDADSGYFADLASYMLMNETSIGELNKRLDRTVTSLQFRPNIVVSGCEPFNEDSWEWIKIGESVLLRNVKPCPRCAMVRIDPETAAVDQLEPLKTLRSFREQTDPKRVEVDGKAPTLGIYCGLYRSGPVKIGDRIFVRPFEKHTSS